MLAHWRRFLVPIGLLVLALALAILVASPLDAGKVITARITTFSGTSEDGSLQEALDAAIHAAAGAAPGADRQTVWRVTRISGLSGGIKPAKRVVVTVEAHW